MPTPNVGCKIVTILPAQGFIMSVSRLVGLVIVLIGLLSGAVLVAQPFFGGLQAAPQTMGLLFVACLVLGLPLYATGNGREIALRVAGGALVGIGLFSLLGLFVDGTGLVLAQRPTAALWLMAPVGLVTGLLMHHFANALGRLQTGEPQS